jgi:hypothetical protein
LNNLPNNTKTTPSSDMIKQISDALNDNSTVAIVITLTLGGCFVYKTYIDAKYNRETKLSYTPNIGFEYTSRPVTQDNSTACTA